MSTGISWNKRSNKPEWPAYSRLICLVMVLYDYQAPSVEGLNSAMNSEMPLHHYCTISPMCWNRAEIRRPYSALFWQDRERMEKEHITSGKNAKYVRAHKSFERTRNRSYYQTME